MPPDFNQKTIDTLAKRAGFLCSNPDCRTLTAGPNSDVTKSTLIGEAAHVYGARPKSARFKGEMTDAARAEITNAIWLCRNCHKLVDRDSFSYSAELLYSWREIHDEFILNERGSQNDKARFRIQHEAVEQFKDYSAIIRRIILDKSPAWEWRLTGELARHLNGPLFRKLNDLQNDLYSREREIVSDSDAFDWVNERFHEISNLQKPFEGLMKQLNDSWGESGEPGNADNIHHVCKLMRDNLETIVRHEERLKFSKLPEKYEPLVKKLRGTMAFAIKEIELIPSHMDDMLSLVENIDEEKGDNPINVTKTITLNLPPNWNKDIDTEIAKLKSRISEEKELDDDDYDYCDNPYDAYAPQYVEQKREKFGCVTALGWGVIFFFLWLMIF